MRKRRTGKSLWEKAKNRFECPVCKRFYENVERHVKSVHPDTSLEVIDGQLSLLGERADPDDDRFQRDMARYLGKKSDGGAA